MLQVARGEGLPLHREVAEADIQALRGRLAGMLVFCTLDPPESLSKFNEGLGALLNHRETVEPRTN